MTLDQARQGESLRVIGVPEGDVRSQMLRLGIGEGSEISCVLKIPAGPIVVRRGTLEIALGRGLAAGIRVLRPDA